MMESFIINIRNDKEEGELSNDEGNDKQGEGSARNSYKDRENRTQRHHFTDQSRKFDSRNQCSLKQKEKSVGENCRFRAVRGIMSHYRKGQDSRRATVSKRNKSHLSMVHRWYRGTPVRSLSLPGHTRSSRSKKVINIQKHRPQGQIRNVSTNNQLISLEMEHKRILEELKQLDEEESPVCASSMLHESLLDVTEILQNLENESNIDKLSDPLMSSYTSKTETENEEFHKLPGDISVKNLHQLPSEPQTYSVQEWQQKLQGVKEILVKDQNIKKLVKHSKEQDTVRKDEVIVLMKENVPNQDVSCKRQGRPKASENLPSTMYQNFSGRDKNAVSQPNFPQHLHTKQHLYSQHSHIPPQEQLRNRDVLNNTGIRRNPSDSRRTDISYQPKSCMPEVTFPSDNYLPKPIGKAISSDIFQDHKEVDMSLHRSKSLSDDAISKQLRLIRQEEEKHHPNAAKRRRTSQVPSSWKDFTNDSDINVKKPKRPLIDYSPDYLASLPDPYVDTHVIDKFASYQSDYPMETHRPSLTSQRSVNNNFGINSHHCLSNSRDKNAYIVSKPSTPQGTSNILSIRSNLTGRTPNLPRKHFSVENHITINMSDTSHSSGNNRHVILKDPSTDTARSSSSHEQPVSEFVVVLPCDRSTFLQKQDDKTGTRTLVRASLKEVKKSSSSSSIQISKSPATVLQDVQTRENNQRNDSDSEEECMLRKMLLEEVQEKRKISNKDPSCELTEKHASEETSQSPLIGDININRFTRGVDHNSATSNKDLLKFGLESTDESIVIKIETNASEEISQLAVGNNDRVNSEDDSCATIQASNSAGAFIIESQTLISEEMSRLPVEDTNTDITIREDNLEKVKYLFELDPNMTAANDMEIPTPILELTQITVVEDTNAGVIIKEENLEEVKSIFKATPDMTTGTIVSEEVTLVLVNEDSKNDVATKEENLCSIAENIDLPQMNPNTTEPPVMRAEIHDSEVQHLSVNTDKNQDKITEEEDHNANHQEDTNCSKLYLDNPGIAVIKPHMPAVEEISQLSAEDNTGSIIMEEDHTTAAKYRELTKFNLHSMETLVIKTEKPDPEVSPNSVVKDKNKGYITKEQCTTVSPFLSESIGVRRSPLSFQEDLHNDNSCNSGPSNVSPLHVSSIKSVKSTERDGNIDLVGYQTDKEIKTTDYDSSSRVKSSNSYSGSSHLAFLSKNAQITESPPNLWRSKLSLSLDDSSSKKTTEASQSSKSVYHRLGPPAETAPSDSWTATSNKPLVTNVRSRLLPATSPSYSKRNQVGQNKLAHNYSSHQTSSSHSYTLSTRRRYKKHPELPVHPQVLVPISSSVSDDDSDMQTDCSADLTTPLHRGQEQDCDLSHEETQKIYDKERVSLQLLGKHQEKPSYVEQGNKLSVNAMKVTAEEIRKFRHKEEEKLNNLHNFRSLLEAQISIQEKLITSYKKHEDFLHEKITAMQEKNNLTRAEQKHMLMEKEKVIAEKLRTLKEEIAAKKERRQTSTLNVVPDMMQLSGLEGNYQSRIFTDMEGCPNRSDKERHNPLMDMNTSILPDISATQFTSSVPTNMGQVPDIPVTQFTSSMTTNMGQVPDIPVTQYTSSMTTNMGQVPDIPVTQYTSSMTTNMGQVPDIPVTQFTSSVTTNMGQVSDIPVTQFTSSVTTNLGQVPDIPVTQYTSSVTTNMGQVPDIPVTW